MVNCIMGVGVLGYPYCFKSSGTLLATTVMIVTMLATRASYQLLLHCAHLSGRRTYEQVRAARGG
jgi:sodium-coupled neutral amino acid transporter 10